MVGLSKKNNRSKLFLAASVLIVALMAFTAFAAVSASDDSEADPGIVTISIDKDLIYDGHPITVGKSLPGSPNTYDIEYNTTYSGEPAISYEQYVGDSWVDFDSTPKDAGTYRMTLYFGDEGTLTAGIFNKEFTINEKTISFPSAYANAKTYNGNAIVTNYIILGEMSGKIDGDDVELASGWYASVVDAGAGIGKAVTFTDFVLTGADASNYTLTVPVLTIDISKRNLTVTDPTGDKDKIYDGTDDMPSQTIGTVKGWAGTDASFVSVEIASAKYASANVGTSIGYTISYQFTVASTDLKNNYELPEDDTGTGTISAASFTSAIFTLESTSGTYKASAYAVTVASVTLSGFTITSSDYDISCPSDMTNQGVKIIKLVGKGNFTGTTTASVNFTINKKQLEVTDPSGTKDKTYDSTDSMPAQTIGTVTGWQGSDASSVAVEIASAKYASANAGNSVAYTVKYQFTAASTDLKNNYILPVDDTGTGKISPADFTGATFTLSSTSGDYKGDTYVVSVSSITLSGFTIKSSDYDVSYPSDMTNAGVKAIKLTGKGNFTGTTTASQDFTINKKALNISAISKPYFGGKIFGCPYETGVKSEYITLSITVGASDAGTYAYTTSTPSSSQYVIDISLHTNYSIASAGDLTITPVSFSDASFGLVSTGGTYNGSAFTVTPKDVTLSGFTITSSDYDVSYPSDMTNAGVKAIKLTGKGNFTGTTTSSVNFTISPADFTGATFGLVSTNGPYKGSAYTVTPKDVMLSGFTITSSDYDVSYPSDMTNAGVKAIKLTGKGNFTGTTASSVNFTVKRTLIYVTPDSGQSKEYGDTDPTYTYHYSGGVSGQTAKFTGVLSREAGSNVGEYKILQNNLQLDDNGTFLKDNYSIFFTTGVKFAITKATITVVPDSGQIKIYGESEPVLSYGCSGSKYMEAPAFTGALTREAGFDVGTYVISLGTLALADNDPFFKSNYNIALSSTPVSFIISPKTISITGVTAVNRVYDGSTTVELTGGALQGVETGDDVSFTLGNGTVDKYVGTDKSVSTEIVLTGSKSGNYVLPQPPYVTVNITPRTLTVTPNSGQSKEYGSADPSLTYSYGNNVSGETPVFTGKLKRASGENVGSYAISNDDLALADNGTFAAFNYSLDVVTTVNFAITKATITVTPDSGKSKIYGTADPTLTYTSSGAKNSEVPVFAGALSRASGNDVGDYNITIGDLELINGSGFSKDNYNLVLSSTPVTFAITQKTITITGVTATDRVYDGSTAVELSGGALQGVESGDTENVSFTLGNGTVDKNVGTAKEVMTSITLTGAKSGNYVLTQPTDVTVDITSRTLTVTPNSGQSKEYGSADPSLTYSYGNNVSGETPVFTGSLKRASGENVGSYAISNDDLTLADNGSFLASNYSLDVVTTVNFAITKATITVTPNSGQSKVYGTADPTFTYTSSGAKNSEVPAFTGALSRAAGSDAGQYDITVGSLALADNGSFLASNYDLAMCSPAVKFEIAKATPEITTEPTASDITYGQKLSASTLSGGAASVGGSFDWTNPTFIPTIAQGASKQSVIFTPADTTNYNNVTLSIAVIVNKATPSITTAPTASAITYGMTLLSSSIGGGIVVNPMNGSMSVAGTFAWDESTISPLVSDSQTTEYDVTFTPTDTSNYNTAALKLKLTVNKATPTINTNPAASGIIYGDKLSASTLGGGSASVPGTFAWTDPDDVPTVAQGAAGLSVTFTPTDTDNYETTTTTVSLVVTQAAPDIVTAPTASAITYGQTLGDSTLSGWKVVNPKDSSMTVGGTFVWIVSTYKPTVNESLTTSYGVTFVPSDSANYVNAPTLVFIVVNKAVPTIQTKPTASGITYEDTLSTSTLTGGQAKNPYDSSAVAGMFAWTVGSFAPTVAQGAAGQSVTFTPTDTDNYETTTTTVKVTVAKKDTSVTTEPVASAITYGQRLSASTLSGGVGSVEGSFNWTEPTKMPTVSDSMNTPFSVTFTPNDTANYNATTTSAMLTVSKATPSVVTDPTVSAITYGQTLAYSSLFGGVIKNPNDPKMSVAGSFSWDAPSTAPAVSDSGKTPYDVTFTPADTVNYDNAHITVKIMVSKATPNIPTKPTASGITYEDALSLSTLTGGQAKNPYDSSVVAGTFAWTNGSAVPTVAQGAAGQSVTFTPTDTANYNTATATVTVTVAKKDTTVTTAPTASAIIYGQILADSTLSGGTGSVAGTFAWTNGMIAPSVADSETTPYSVTFTPGDTANYNSTTETITLKVNKATPNITTKPTASGITYEDALSLSILTGGHAENPYDPMAVAGTFAWTDGTAVPTVAQGAAGQSVTFTPTDTANYTTATTTVVVNVAKKDTTVTTAPTASAITYGQKLSASTLSGGTGSVGGSFAWTDDTIIPTVAQGTAGLSVTFTPQNSDNYNNTTTSVILVVNKATPTVTVKPIASAITYGQTLADSSFTGGVIKNPKNATMSVPGTFTWQTSSTAPAVSDSGTTQYDVVFTPENTADYNNAATSVTLVVNKATPIVTVKPTATGIAYGQKLSDSTLSGGTASVAGSFAWTDMTFVPTIAQGAAGQSVTFTPDDGANYNSAVTSVVLTVYKATPVIVTGPTASAITYGQTLADSSFSGGVIENPNDSTMSVSGLFSWHTSSIAPAVSDSETTPYVVTFTPSDTDNYNSTTTSVTIVVNKATPAITVKPTASAITYGQTLSDSTLSGGTASVAGSFAWTDDTIVPTVAQGTAGMSVTFTPSDTDNYNNAVTTVKVTISKATPSIVTDPTASAITYGQKLSDSTLIGGSVKNPMDATMSVAGTFTWNSPTTAPSVSDSQTTSYLVVFTPEDTANYNTASTSVKLTVNKADASVTVAPTAIDGLIYDQSSHALVSAGSGVIGGTLKYSLDGISYSTAIPEGYYGGTYPVHYKVFGDANHNDSADTVIDAVIEKVHLTMPDAKADPKIYNRDTDVKNYVMLGDLDGILIGDTVNLIYSSWTAAVDDYNVGDDKHINFTGLLLTGADAEGYVLDTESITIDIVPRTITVDGITAVAKDYDGTTSASMNYSGVEFGNAMLGDDLSVTVTGTYADKNTGAYKPVSLSSFVLGGSSAGNYAIDTENSQKYAYASIITREVSITGITAKNKDYDGTKSVVLEGTPVLSWKCDGDDISIVAGTAEFADKNKGDSIAVIFSGYGLTGADYVAGNYSLISQPAATANITAREAELDWTSPVSLVYDKSAKTPSVAVSNIVSGDICNVTSVLTAGKDNVNVGKFTFTATALDNDNYALPAVVTSPEYTITAKTVTLSWTAPSDLTYDKTAKVPTVVVSNLEDGDTCSVTSALTDGKDNVNVGTFTFTATALDNDNYALPAVVTSPEYEITAKTVTLNWTAPSDLTYDKTAKVPTVAASDLEDGDTCSVTSALTDGKDNVNVGAFTFTATALSNGNYALPTVVTSPEYTITPKTAALNWTAPSDLTYDKTAKAPTVVVSNLEDGDVCNVTSVLTAGDDNVNVGSFTFTATILDNVNYVLPDDVTSPEYTITAKTAALNWIAPSDLKYDKTAKVPTAVVSNLEDGDTCSVTAVLTSGKDNVNVGSFTFTATALGNENYVLPDDVTSPEYTITAKTAALNWTAPSDLTYDKTAKVPTVAVSNLEDGDVCNITYGLTTGKDNVNVGKFTFTVTALDNDNYALPSVVTSPEYEITRATPAADDFDYEEPENLIYDDKPKSASVTAKSGIVGMGTVTVRYFSDAARSDGKEVAPADVKLVGMYYVAIDVTQGDNYSAVTKLYDEAWKFKIINLDPMPENFDFTAPEDCEYSATVKSATVEPKDGIIGMGAVTVRYFLEGSRSDGSEILPSDVKNVRTYYVAIDVAKGENYTAATKIFDVSWTFSITQATITVTPDSGQTKVYGDSDPVFTYTYTGVKGSEAASFTGALSREPGEVKGDYAIKLDGLELSSSGEFIKDNYELAMCTPAVTFEITLRPLWVDLDISGLSPREYDATTNVATYEFVFVGAAAGDVPEFSTYSVQMKSPNAGNRMITVSDLELTSEWKQKYDLKTTSFDKGSPVDLIYKAALTPLIDLMMVDVRAYDGTKNITGAILYVSSSTSEYPTVTGVVEMRSPNAGNRGVDAKNIVLDEKWRTNYVLTSDTASTDSYMDLIKPAVPTVILSNKTETYSGEGIAIGAANVTLVNSEVYTGNVVYRYYSNYECTVGETTQAPVNAGKYYVKASTEAIPNYYAAVSNKAVLTIDKKALSGDMIKVDGPFIYDGSSKTVTYTVSDGTALKSSDWTEDSGTQKTATEIGRYKVMIKATFGGNYTGSAEQSWYINMQVMYLYDGETLVGVLDFYEKGIPGDTTYELKRGEVSSEASELLSGKELLYSYSIKLMSEGKEIQPEGKVSVRLLTPDNTKGLQYSVCHIHDGVSQQVDHTEDGGFTAFEVDGFSEFVFVKSNTFSGNTFFYVAIGISAALALIIIAVYRIRR